MIDGLSAETDKFKLSDKKNKEDSKITIVLDPGHGYTKGNTGAACYLYTYKIKGEDGKPVVDEKGEFVTETNDILHLPQYFVDDPNSWIVSKKEDPNHNERSLVYDIASRLKSLFDAQKDTYNCLITRNSRVITGNDDAATRKLRTDLANDNNADYFISIHADGAADNVSTGAHVIYPKTSNLTTKEQSNTLAEDIFRFYNIVQVEDTSPKEDVRGLQVLGNSNKISRKVLVELGYVTTPRDARAMYSNIETIADQLFEGVKYNIRRDEDN